MYGAFQSPGSMSARTKSSSTSGVTTTVVAAAAVATAVGSALYMYSKVSHTIGSTSSTQKKPTKQVKQSEKSISSASSPIVTSSKPCIASEEEDEMFSSPGGPKLFSPSVTFPPKKPAPTTGKRMGDITTVSAEQQQQATLSRSGVVQPLGSGGNATGAEVWTEDIVERAKAMNVLRVLMRRIAINLSDSSDDSDETDSDTTDVSLNLHIAKELELSARDELMEAMNDYMMLEAGNEMMAEARGIGASDGKLEDLTTVLIKATEYLDISNEREKLAVRREELKFSAGAARGTSITAAAAAAAAVGHEGPSSGDGSIATRKAQSTELQARYDELLRAGGGAEMDRLLLGSRKHRPMDDIDDDERAGWFEDDWGDEDNEEADFMAYLQQDDASPHFFTREQVRDARRDPASDVRAFGTDDGFTDILAEMDADAAALWNDNEDKDELEEVIDEEGSEEEEDGGYYEPWTEEEKQEFEEDLITRIYELAERWGVTDEMGERERVMMTERRRVREEKKRSAKASAEMKRAEEEEEENEWETDEDDIDIDEDEEVVTAVPAAVARRMQREVKSQETSASRKTRPARRH